MCHITSDNTSWHRRCWHDSGLPVFAELLMKRLDVFNVTLGHFPAGCFNGTAGIWVTFNDMFGQLWWQKKIFLTRSSDNLSVKTWYFWWDRTLFQQCLRQESGYLLIYVGKNLQLWTVHFEWSVVTFSSCVSGNRAEYFWWDVRTVCSRETGIFNETMGYFLAVSVAIHPGRVSVFSSLYLSGFCT